MRGNGQKTGEMASFPRGPPNANSNWEQEERLSKSPVNTNLLVSQLNLTKTQLGPVFEQLVSHTSPTKSHLGPVSSPMQKKPHKTPSLKAKSSSKFKRQAQCGSLSLSTLARFSPMMGKKRMNQRLVHSAREEVYRKIELQPKSEPKEAMKTTTMV